MTQSCYVGVSKIGENTHTHEHIRHTIDGYISAHFILQSKIGLAKCIIHDAHQKKLMKAHIKI